MKRVIAFAIAALAVAALAVGCVPARSVSEEQRVRVVHRYFDEVWNHGKIEVLEELLAPDYVNHTPSTPDPPPGPDGLKPIIRAFRVAFPDLRFTLLDALSTNLVPRRVQWARSGAARVARAGGSSSRFRAT